MAALCPSFDFRLDFVVISVVRLSVVQSDANFALYPGTGNRHYQECICPRVAILRRFRKRNPELLKDAWQALAELREARQAAKAGSPRQTEAPVPS
jgi:hypothetical protein